MSFKILLFVCIAYISLLYMNEKNKNKNKSILKGHVKRTVLMIEKE